MITRSATVPGNSHKGNENGAAVQHITRKSTSVVATRNGDTTAWKAKRKEGETAAQS
jgi:hypothetical protein